MATDHHHSAFDQDDFDRYDTFEDPVVDNTNPDRNGFAGDFGRLLDQIRINNAANKLDDNVAVGEDRALNVTGNWVAVPHEELYASVHTNNNPAEAYSLAREWTQLGNMMAENSRVMDEAIRSTESGWVGPAAEVARQATLKLATWGGDAAQTSQYMGTRIADQGLAAERAKAAMPEPVQFDYEQMLRQGFATGGLAGLNQAVVDVQMASAQARTAHAQAAQVMSEMESQSRNVDETTPRFVRPPEVTDGAASPVNSLMGTQMPSSPRMTLPNGQLTSAGFEGASLPAGGTSAAFAGGTPAGFSGGAMPGGVAAAGAGAPDFSGMAAGLTGGSASGTSAQRSAGAYTPPKINVPDINIGTSTAGYSPTTPVTGGHPGGTKFGSGYQAPDLTNLLPPSITGGKGRDSSANSPGYVPPKLPTGINPATGLPYTPDEIRRGVPSLRGGMPGGGSGGFGGGGGGAGGLGGGAGGFGGAGASGGGFGRAGMPGMGASVGAVAAAEQAAARGAAGAMAGQAGAAGSPGMGGGGMGGAKGGGGDNDKEHRNKYASNEKVVEEPGRMVPSVIGEKSAKQLSEEQAG